MSFSLVVDPSHTHHTFGMCSTKCQHGFRHKKRDWSHGAAVSANTEGRMELKGSQLSFSANFKDNYELTYNI